MISNQDIYLRNTSVNVGNICLVLTEKLMLRRSQCHKHCCFDAIRAVLDNLVPSSVLHVYLSKRAVKRAGSARRKAVEYRLHSSYLFQLTVINVYL
jgi:hypothetical protein